MMMVMLVVLILGIVCVCDVSLHIYTFSKLVDKNMVLMNGPIHEYTQHTH